MISVNLPTSLRAIFRLSVLIALSAAFKGCDQDPVLCSVLRARRERLTPGKAGRGETVLSL